MLIHLSPGASFPVEFPKGAVLLADKPLAWTSFDVVNKVRNALSRRLGVKKIKLGHAGTLDPLATGLLVLCAGDYTRRIDEFQGLPKEYSGTITFGATTPSFDLEHPVDNTFPVSHLNDELLQGLLPQFTGDIFQLPPIFSAVKVEGKRLYKKARAGSDVELQPRAVTIHHLELGSLRPVPPSDAQPRIINAKGTPIHLHPDYPQGLQADFKVRCSKGTYIRSLAHDLGQAAKSGAYLSGLRRTGIGHFQVENAWNLEELVAWIQKS